MRCQTDIAVTDLVLAIISNTITTSSAQKLLTHVDSCEACANRLSTHLAMVGRIDRITRSSRDSKESCLDENTFAEFIDATMPTEEYNNTMSHLAQCQNCVSQLSALVTCLDEIEPLPVSYIFKRVRDGLQLLLHPENGFTLMTHEPVPVLNAITQQEFIHSWRQEMDDYSIEFNLQELGQDLFSILITLVSSEKTRGSFQIAIRACGNIIQAQPLQDSSKIRFDNLLPKKYEIEITTPKGRSKTVGLTIE